MRINTGFFESEPEKKQKKSFLEALRVYYVDNITFNYRLNRIVKGIQNLDDYRDALLALGDPYSEAELVELIDYTDVTAVNEEDHLIFVYDDSSAFTEKRKVTLEHYPKDICLGYPKGYWIRACERSRVQPVTALERAFKEMITDIEGYRLGYTVVRIEHGEFDWTVDSNELIARLVSNAKKACFDLS